MFANTTLLYATLLIKANEKRSFEYLGRLIGRSGDTIKRLLSPATAISILLTHIAVKFFDGKTELYLAIDDTLIKKIYSKYMQGSGRFFDTQIGRKIISYKLLCAAITDGNYTIPLFAAFLFDKELLAEPINSKGDLVKAAIIHVKKIFPNIQIIAVLDGAFASKEFFRWCKKQSIAAELRMHSNRRVEFKGQRRVIKEIDELQPKGRHMARTIEVLWHDIALQITAQRRIDKHGVETIVYQAATYNAKPAKHVAVYKKRWPIEMFFRTAKQHLGLQDCYSLNIDVQTNHVISVFLAFALIQLDRKQYKRNTPEDAIRILKRKNVLSLNDHITRLGKIFEGIYA